jgi:RNA polymerase sigma-B factor
MGSGSRTTGIGTESGANLSTAIRHGAENADDRELIRRYREGDESAREVLVERYLPLARRLARRYKYSGEELEDLYQVASLALLKALERFDPERGSDFASYAVPTVLGELKRHFRDHTWAVHVPRDLQERTVKVSSAIEELGKSLGRPPSTRELAERLEMDIEEIVEALGATTAYDALSLEAEPNEATETTTLGDSIGEIDPRYELVEYGAAIADTLDEMPERERVVLHLRFVEDLTQTQIAERIGVSQMQVSRLIRRAVSRLQDSASETPEGEDREQE